MKLITLLFALIAVGTGVKAAWLWYKASVISPDPGWQNPLAPTPAAPIEPLDRTQAQGQWISVMLESAERSAALNSLASRWTAASVLFSGFSALFGYF